MKHQYRTKGFWKKSLQQIVDFFVDIYAKLFIEQTPTGESLNPKKILFVSLGHLGDALIGSYLFPLIRERFPEAELDVLANEWCKPVLEDNPYINKLIFHNHLRGNRANISLWKKINRHYKSLKNVIETVRTANYDLSIEGRISHPNGNLICYRCKIKRRIGFGSGGFGSLLTDEISFPEEPDFHFLQAVLKELRKLGIEKKIDEIKPYFFTSKKMIEEKHIYHLNFDEKYMVIQPESGYALRMMSNKFWLEIIRIIMKLKNYKIFICGTSIRSIDLYDFVVRNLADSSGKIINTVQKLSMDEFFILAKHAVLAVTVESLAAHLCSVSCRTISFYKNGAGSLFFPIPNIDTTVIHNNIPSRNARVHPVIKNYYVKEFESDETYHLFETLVKEKLQE